MSQTLFFYMFYLIYNIIILDIYCDNIIMWYNRDNKFVFCGPMNLESIIGRDKQLNNVYVGKLQKWFRLIFPQFVWLIGEWEIN